MKYPGDITPEAYAAMEEGYDQGRAEGRQELARLRARIEVLAARWELPSCQFDAPGADWAAELRAVLAGEGG